MNHNAVKLPTLQRTVSKAVQPLRPTSTPMEITPTPSSSSSSSTSWVQIHPAPSKPPSNASGKLYSGSESSDPKQKDSGSSSDVKSIKKSQPTTISTDTPNDPFASITDPERKLMYGKLMKSDTTGGMLNIKRYYANFNSASLVGATNTNYILNNVTQQTATVNPSIATRINQSIHCHRIKCRYSIQWLSVGNSTDGDWHYRPVILVLYRDKLPITPGTAPTCFGTGQDPPDASTFQMFNRLGDLTTAQAANFRAFRDPFFSTFQHVYFYKLVNPPMRALNVGAFSGANGVGASWPQVVHEEFDVDLHKFITNFPNGSNSPMTNSLFLTAIPTEGLEANQAINMELSSELMFTDAPL